MSNLGEIIPGAQYWPKFRRNTSEQFEARFVMVEIQRTPSLFFRDMAGSRIPIVVSHGEGRADFHGKRNFERINQLVTLRYTNNHGDVTEKYPYNPNGSPHGIAGMTTADGRFSILMPHPERVFRTVQNSWHPREWVEDSPWLTMFKNARRALG